MSNTMKIDLALAQLEAGKFSFQMVDAIKDHVARLEAETSALRDTHEEAVSELQRQQYANWRLEAETQKLNAKIHALVKANAISELVCRESAALSVTLRDYLAVSARVARAGLDRAVAEFRSGRPQAEAARMSAALVAFVREHAPTEQATRETLAQLEPHFEAIKTRLRPSFEKTVAYVANMKKTAA